jgi:hypothetical protein
MAKSLDINASPFNVGDYVNVRCLVVAITDQNGSLPPNGSFADLITCVVDAPGDIGEKQNVQIIVSPVQVRRSQGLVSPPTVTPNNTTSE